MKGGHGDLLIFWLAQEMGPAGGSSGLKPNKNLATKRKNRPGLAAGELHPISLHYKMFDVYFFFRIWSKLIEHDYKQAKVSLAIKDRCEYGQRRYCKWKWTNFHFLPNLWCNRWTSLSWIHPPLAQFVRMRRKSKSNECFKKVKIPLPKAPIESSTRCKSSVNRIGKRRWNKLET